MKYFIIPYISLGLILSVFIGIEYQCEGTEMFPNYYGSPFVFKKNSLASSMQYYYNVVGLLLNIFIWSSFLLFIDKLLQTILIKFKNLKWMPKLYKMLIVFLIIISSSSILLNSLLLGRGFGVGSNYWYWDMDKEAKDWGMTCQGECIIMLNKSSL